jgi:hypothetical protein
MKTDGVSGCPIREAWILAQFYGALVEDREAGVMEYWSVDYWSARFSEFSDAQNSSSPVKRHLWTLSCEITRKHPFIHALARKHVSFTYSRLSHFQKKVLPGRN